MPEELRLYDSRVTLICVDSYENRIPTGRLCGPCMGEGGEFRSLAEFLLKMDGILNAAQAPLSSANGREFGPDDCSAAEHSVEAEPQSGKLATFAMRILFQKNASWQGSVTWLEGGETQNFRSVLELVQLMDSAIRAIKK